MAINPLYKKQYVDLNKRILAINLRSINPDKVERGLPLKEQAKMARKFFKEIGIGELSVKQATGAWCFYCYVDYPKRFSKQAEGSCVFPVTMPNEVVNKLYKILDKRFPNYKDKSDSMTDYYDDKWHISHATGPNWEVTEEDLF